MLLVDQINVLLCQIRILLDVLTNIPHFYTHSNKRDQTRFEQVEKEEERWEWGGGSKYGVQGGNIPLKGWG